MTSSSHFSIGTRGYLSLTESSSSTGKGRPVRKRKLESVSFGDNVRSKTLTSLSYLNQYVKLPSQVVDCERRENTDWLSLVLSPSTKSVKVVYEKCLQQNDESYSGLFSFVDNQIFVKDMFRCGESPIHGAASCFFTSLFRRYGDSFHKLLGQDAFQYQCHRSQTYVGVPDAMIAVPGEGTSSYPIVMLEIGYETCLGDLHRKALNYISAHETLHVIFVLDIGYPWETSYDSDANVEYLSQSGGKLTIFRYERGHVAPVGAISFGKVALSQHDIAIASEITGIPMSSIVGNVEESLGENDYFIQYRGPPCHQRAMSEYQIRVSLVSLLSDCIGAQSSSPLWEQLKSLGLSTPPADLVFDLFALQYDIHRHGVHQTNQIIAVQNGAQHYTIPPRPVDVDPPSSACKCD